MNIIIEQVNVTEIAIDTSLVNSMLDKILFNHCDLVVYAGDMDKFIAGCKKLAINHSNHVTVYKDLKGNILFASDYHKNPYNVQVIASAKEGELKKVDEKTYKYHYPLEHEGRDYSTNLTIKKRSDGVWHDMTFDLEADSPEEVVQMYWDMLEEEAGHYWEAEKELSKATAKYSLKCLQRGTIYPEYAEPEYFNTLEEVKDHLIDYHSVDLDDDEIEELRGLNAHEIADAFEWEIIEKPAKAKADVEVKKGRVSVAIEYIGEGYNGEYDPDDAEDEPLVRFTVLHKGIPVDDASYCTTISDNVSDIEKKKMANIILEEVYEDVVAGNSIKKKCEELSWIKLDQVKATADYLENKYANEHEEFTIHDLQKDAGPIPALRPFKDAYYSIVHFNKESEQFEILIYAKEADYKSDKPKIIILDPLLRAVATASVEFVDSDDVEEELKAICNLFEDEEFEYKDGNILYVDSCDYEDRIYDTSDISLKCVKLEDSGEDDPKETKVRRTLINLLDDIESGVLKPVSKYYSKTEIDKAIKKLEKAISENIEFKGSADYGTPAAVLRVIDDNLDKIERVYYDYSGRGMYGSKCFGIIVGQFDKNEMLKEFGKLGVTPTYDNMGMDWILYWPGYSSSKIKEADENNILRLLESDKDEAEAHVTTAVDEIAEFVEDINKLRLDHKNKWYVWSGMVNGKLVEIKGYNTWLQIFKIDGKSVPSGMDISVKEFKSHLENSLRRHSKVEAGPGAGVTINLSTFKVPFCVNNGVAKFEPVLVDVEFNSAYDTQIAEEGLSIQMDDVSDPEEVEVLLNKYGFLKEGEECGEVRISAGEAHDEKGRRVVLSPGWSRAIYKKGDIFEFADQDTWLKGTATFTENGEYAWADLDSLEEDEEAEASVNKIVFDGKNAEDILELLKNHDIEVGQEENGRLFTKQNGEEVNILKDDILSIKDGVLHIKKPAYTIKADVNPKTLKCKRLVKLLTDGGFEVKDISAEQYGTRRMAYVRFISNEERLKAEKFLIDNDYKVNLKYRPGSSTAEVFIGSYNGKYDGFVEAETETTATKHTYTMTQQGEVKAYQSSGLGWEDTDGCTLTYDARQNWLDEANKDLEDLHEYVADQSGLPITQIQVHNLDAFGVATYEICSDRELNQKELEKLKEVMLGQLSDGWGEGFEQRWEYIEYGDSRDTQYMYSPWKRGGNTTIASQDTVAVHPSEKGSQELRLHMIKDRHIDDIAKLANTGIVQHAILTDLKPDQVKAVRKALVAVGNRNMKVDGKGKGSVGSDIAEFAAWITSDIMGNVADYLLDAIGDRSEKEVYAFSFEKFEKALIDFYKRGVPESVHSYWDDVIYTKKAIGSSEVKTEEDFDNLYTYDSSIKSEEFDPEDQPGMLETFGNDLKQVLEISRKSPKRVWTMVDGDDGMYLIQGYHLVNRIYYVITVEEAQSEGEEYLIESYASEATASEDFHTVYLKSPMSEELAKELISKLELAGYEVALVDGNAALNLYGILSPEKLDQASEIIGKDLVIEVA